MDGGQPKGLTARHALYLEEERKLDVETCVRLGMYSDGKVIAFPYHDDAGQFLYAKLRDPADKSRMRCEPAGIEQTRLWGEETLKEDPGMEPLCITEGEYDRTACHQVGMPFVVSVPSGSANSYEGARTKAVRCLAVDGDERKGLKPDVAKFSKIILALDNDIEGSYLRDAIIELVGGEYCYLPEYPPGCKDPNDVLKNVDPTGAALRALLEAAPPAKHDGITPFMEVDREPLVTYGIGIEPLADYCRFTVPEFFVLGGEANIGKSTIGHLILFGYLRENPHQKAVVFNGEGSKSIIVQRALRFANQRARARGYDTADKDYQAKRDKWINEHLAFIDPHPDTTPDLDWVLWAMERAALVHGGTSGVH